MEKVPGGRLLGRVTILPAVLDGCWQAHKECTAKTRRVWEPCCQQEVDREQPVSLQGHCVLWKTSLSSIFPFIPCLEQIQSHREGTGMGATVTDSHSQHVSKREHQSSSSAPGTACSEPWRCCRHPQLPGHCQSVQEEPHLGTRVKKKRHLTSWF